MSKRKPNEEVDSTGLEIRISQSWIRLVRLCQTVAPNGEITVKIVNGEPTEVTSIKHKIRVDKEMALPTQLVELA